MKKNIAPVPKNVLVHYNITILTVVLSRSVLV